MNARDLMALAEVIRDEDFRLMAAKNHDYAPEDDALANLREFGLHGIIVRLGDKLARLRNFDSRRATGETGVLRVANEPIKETLRDIRNYSTLAEILLDEEEK